MLAVSTAWNADRCGGWAAAVDELVTLGRPRVALDGPALYPDAAAAGRAARAAKGSVVAVFAPAPRADSTAPAAALGLASPRDEARTVAVRAAYRAAQCARAAGTGLVVLRAGEIPRLGTGLPEWLDRLGREGVTAAVRDEVAAALAEVASDRVRFLEALCRSLWELCKADGEITWLLATPSSPFGVPLPAEVEDVFGELTGRRVGWWHDAGDAALLDALGCAPAEEWLARLGSRTAGLTVTDWSPTGAGLPAGSGIVDWAALRAQCTERMERVVRLDPVYPAPLLADALREAASLIG